MRIAGQPASHGGFYKDFAESEISATSSSLKNQRYIAAINKNLLDED